MYLYLICLNNDINYRGVAVIFQHPVALCTLTQVFFCRPSATNCWLFLYWKTIFVHSFTTCFDLTGHLQVCTPTRILLHTAMRCSFRSHPPQVIFRCTWLFCNVWCAMLELLVYMYLQLLYTRCYLQFCLWLSCVFLLVRALCFLLFGHHRLSLWVYSWRNKTAKSAYTLQQDAEK
jgi:hypothetical protein